MKIYPATLSLKDSHHVQMSAIVPRPIAFVSTVGTNGIHDVAPYSSFMTLSIDPNLVAFSSSWKRDGQKKRTLANIESSREFVLNLVTEEVIKAMNQSSAIYPSHVDKIKAIGLTAAKADMVMAPTLAESPVNLECRVQQILEFGKLPRRTSLIIAEVLIIHVKDELLKNGEIDASRVKAIGRLGGDYYCRLTDIFEMERPEAY